MTGIYIALAVVLALVLPAVLVHRRGRGDWATNPDALGSAVVATSGGSPTSPTHAVGPGPDDLVLVPFPNDTGQALVVGTETRSRSSTGAASGSAMRAPPPDRSRSSFGMRWRPAA